jgi:hypothetical protein
MTRRSLLIKWGVVMLAVWGPACIDPEADYAAFAERPLAEREASVVDVPLTPCQELLKGFQPGKFLATCRPIATGLPFALLAEQSVTTSADGTTGTFKMSLQGLKYMATNASEIVGGSIPLTPAMVGSDCTYTDNVERLVIPAETTILNRELVAQNVILRGKLQSVERSCAELDGDVPIIGLMLNGDGDICLFLRLPPDGTLPIVTDNDYACDPSILPPR